MMACVLADEGLPLPCIEQHREINIQSSYALGEGAKVQTLDEQK